jgi:hypothetical protein
MDNTTNLPRSLIVSSRIYKLLLGVYPSEFRREYSSPMQQVFRDCLLRAEREGGPWALAELWARTMLDTVSTAVEEHSRRGVDMSREKFYKLSGWALILGPLLFLIGGWANNRPQYSPFNAAAGPLDRYANAADTPLIVLGLVFVSLGLIGMMLRFSPRLDSSGILLAIGALAGLISAGGVVLMAITPGDDWESVGWFTFLLGLAVQYVALTIFGIITLRRKLLPRWNGLPLLALWMPALLLFSLGIGPWEPGIQVFAYLWILTIIMFAGLGYLLLSSPSSVQKAAAA